MTTQTPAEPVLQPATEGLIERRWRIEDLEIRDSRNGEGDYTLRGHAAPFNSLSEDLGGFREIIEPGFFRSVLRTNPDVRLLMDHIPQSNLVLGRTASGTLELREDDRGLHVWARVAPTSVATDLRTVMQRGDVDQMSFAFTIREGGDDWAVTEDGTIVRTLRADGCDGLYDVSVVVYPAYPRSDANMRSNVKANQRMLHEAIRSGRLPESLLAEITPDAAAETLAVEELPRSGNAGGDERAMNKGLEALRAYSRSRLHSVTSKHKD